MPEISQFAHTSLCQLLAPGGFCAILESSSIFTCFHKTRRPRLSVAIGQAIIVQSNVKRTKIYLLPYILSKVVTGCS